MELPSKNGFPDFSPFMKRGPDGNPTEVEIPDMRGNNDGARRDGTFGDFGQARKAMEERLGQRWYSGAEERGSTWHHKEDGTTMQLVDFEVHDNTPHQGGASMMRDQATF
jgi:hypothetical protein